MVELFEKTGILSLGSRLRRLSEIVTRDACEIYRLYGLEIKPKWFPVLYVLFEGNVNSVTGIAKSIGQTHPSVSNLVKEMASAGVITETRDDSDRRSTLVSLTEKGLSMRDSLLRACEDVREAVSAIDSQSENKMWDAIGFWEEKLEEKSLLTRVAEVKSRKKATKIEITDYSPEYLSVFKRLNIMWINSHWSLEPHDLEVLGNPEESILSKGGHIFVALAEGKPVGVVALCAMDHTVYDYELAKLAVDPEARGGGIGRALCTEAINRARKLGGKKLFLESNTLLKPAISLYRKLGFTELKEYHPAYKRGDIQMELILD